MAALIGVERRAFGATLSEPVLTLMLMFPLVPVILPAVKEFAERMLMFCAVDATDPRKVDWVALTSLVVPAVKVTVPDDVADRVPAPMTVNPAAPATVR